jgi:predicted GIY-YIG superfamily endonuclease
MDVSRRVAEHQSKSRKSARFTRAFSHIELVYSVPACNRSTAAKLEFHLKKKSHREKSLIIQQQFTLEQLWNYLFP